LARIPGAIARGARGASQVVHSGVQGFLDWRRRNGEWYAAHEEALMQERIAAYEEAQMRERKEVENGARRGRIDGGEHVDDRPGDGQLTANPAPQATGPGSLADFETRMQAAQDAITSLTDVSLKDDFQGYINLLKAVTIKPSKKEKMLTTLENRLREVAQGSAGGPSNAAFAAAPAPAPRPVQAAPAPLPVAPAPAPQPVEPAPAPQPVAPAPAPGAVAPARGRNPAIVGQVHTAIYSIPDKNLVQTPAARAQLRIHVGRIMRMIAPHADWTIDQVDTAINHVMTHIEGVRADELKRVLENILDRTMGGGVIEGVRGVPNNNPLAAIRGPVSGNFGGAGKPELAQKRARAPHQIAGSPEAKEHMAKLRAKRAKKGES